MIVRIVWAMACVWVLQPQLRGDEPAFIDSFDEGLSPQWQVIGMEPEDYRIRNGGLEIRVGSSQDGMRRVRVPFSVGPDETAASSVEVTIVEGELERGESAGIQFYRDDLVLFSVRKTNINGFLVLSPAEVKFEGEPGEEGDPNLYSTKYWPANAERGPLRILIQGSYAFFQVGPSTDGEYGNYFHSAISDEPGESGFELFVESEREESDCWVRFDNVKLTK